MSKQFFPFWLQLSIWHIKCKGNPLDDENHKYSIFLLKNWPYNFIQSKLNDWPSFPAVFRCLIPSSCLPLSLFVSQEAEQFYATYRREFYLLFSLSCASESDTIDLFHSCCFSTSCTGGGGGSIGGQAGWGGTWVGLWREAELFTFFFSAMQHARKARIALIIDCIPLLEMHEWLSSSSESSLLTEAPPTPSMYQYRPGYSSPGRNHTALPHPNKVYASLYLETSNCWAYMGWYCMQTSRGFCRYYQKNQHELRH